MNEVMTVNGGDEQDRQLQYADISGSLDSLVLTAKRFPRNPAHFTKSCKALVASNHDIAKAAIYSRPVGGGKIATGPSVRLAELIVSEWKNLDAGARIVADNPTNVVAQGVFYDMERNIRISVEVPRSVMTSPKKGEPKRMSDSQCEVIKLAAMAIAYRNSVFKAIPKIYWGPIYEQAVRTVAKGPNGEDLHKRIEKAVAWFGSKGLQEPDLLRLLRVSSRKAISEDDFVTLVGLMNAVLEGSLTISDLRGESRLEEEPLVPAGAENPFDVAAREEEDRVAEFQVVEEDTVDGSIVDFDDDAAQASFDELMDAIGQCETLAAVDKLWKGVTLQQKQSMSGPQLSALSRAVSDRKDALK